VWATEETLISNRISLYFNIFLLTCYSGGQFYSRSVVYFQSSHDPHLFDLWNRCLHLFVLRKAPRWKLFLILFQREETDLDIHFVDVFRYGSKESRSV
jgi:hypothetical protein